MSCHSTEFIWPAFIAVLALSGCASLSDPGEIAQSAHGVVDDVTLNCEEPPQGIVNATSSSNFVLRTVSQTNLEISAPDDLVNSNVMKAVVQFYSVGTPTYRSGLRAASAQPMNSLVLAAPTTKSPLATLNSRDFQDFSSVYVQTIMAPSTYTGNNPGQRVYQEKSLGASAAGLNEKRDNLAFVFQQYYKAYLAGNYVDRNGSKYSKPEIKTKIGNDIIKASLRIFMEALGDTQLATPIVKDSSGKYFPGNNANRPSASEFKFVQTVDTISDPTKCGITLKEAEAISYLSNLAGDQSEFISGLILESLGDVQLAVVVGAHFSIGDNETLVTLVKTFFESVSRQLTERGAYEFFQVFSYSPVGTYNVVGNPSLEFIDPANPLMAAASVSAKQAQQLQNVATFLEDF